jgi:hypothetical protein
MRGKRRATSFVATMMFLSAFLTGPAVVSPGSLHGMGTYASSNSVIAGYHDF